MMDVIGTFEIHISDDDFTDFTSPSIHPCGKWEKIYLRTGTGRLGTVPLENDRTLSSEAAVHPQSG